MKIRTIQSHYQAVLPTPFGCIGIVLANEKLHGIDFLPADYPLQAPDSPLSRRVAAALNHYFDDPGSSFDLPLEILGTAHQVKVWHALIAIRPGHTSTYGQLARLLDSSPRAIGQACGANPLPIIIPCHRVVAANGRGGFMHQVSGAPLTYKNWLLRHESRITAGA